MNVNMRSDTDFVCNMDVFTSAERENHFRAAAKLYKSVQEIQETETGYKFRFPNTSENIMKLAEFISNERLCCPFLDFTLNVSPNDALISLLLSGPDGTKKFLQAELHEAFE